MKTFSLIEAKTLSLLSILIIGLAAVFLFLLQEGQTGLLLNIFLVILTAISLVGGPVVGLVSSLLFIFVIGTFLLFLFFSASSSGILTIPLPYLLGFGFVLLLTALLAGKIHDQIIGQSRLNRRLQEEIDQLVAVDVETGFDNRRRMEVELDVEMRRSKRYGGTFTIILLELEFFEEFQRLYGEKELKHLVASLADKMQTIIRSTDRKFRYANNRFALLLTHTDDASIEIIYEKLTKKLKDHELLSEKYVTLSFRTAFQEFDKQADFQDSAALISQIESGMVVRDL
ncbi:diguanylate cyclase domain-containing protein [Sporosarcina cascadiensis]|uniref:diguanylate cyclase domain-containing protein n=1 Tax=Sporosarcina cascadiensis TaxID=2660747 RepID=UPI00129B436C|nr:diguanylate cyclase [Sporosarcina cascadiensis]